LTFLTDFFDQVLREQINQCGARFWNMEMGVSGGTTTQLAPQFHKSLWLCEVLRRQEDRQSDHSSLSRVVVDPGRTTERRQFGKTRVGQQPLQSHSDSMRSGAMVSVSCGFSAFLPQLQCRHRLRPCDLSTFGGLFAFFLKLFF
jgi:hypothetical protein